MVRVNSPGVCSTVKSKLRHVRRSLSATSLDVRGSVVMEKVWMFEGITEGISTEQLSEEDTGKDYWCPKHNWFLSTNLLTAQQCAKCLKRILPKRATYKCTACKRLCHLKCAIESTNIDQAKQNDYKGPTLRERKPKTIMDFRDFVPKENPQSCRYTRKTSNRRHHSPYSQKEVNNNVIEEPEIQAPEDTATEQIDSIESRQIPDLSLLSELHNTSRQSQAKHKLTSMKHGFVKRCRSLKNKVRTLTDKKVNPGGDKNSDNQARQESSTSTSSTLNSEEQVEQERQAWARSPIRTRLRERQLELRRESLRSKIAARRNNANGDNTSIKKKAANGVQTRNSRRHRFQAYDLDLVTLNDRLLEIEKRVGELETAIPQELEEWQRLKQKFRGESYTNVNRRKNERELEEQIIHETHPKHIEAMGGLPSSSSGTTSDDVYIVPDHQRCSSHDEEEHVMSDAGNMRYDNEKMRYDDDNMRYDEDNVRYDEDNMRYDDEKMRYDEDNVRYDGGYMRKYEEYMKYNSGYTRQNEGQTRYDGYTRQDESQTRYDEDHTGYSDGYRRQNEEHLLHSPINSLNEDSLPSGIPSKLRMKLCSDTPGKLQTSTPVTEREISFLSASRQYRDTHQIHHTNVTQINVEHSYSDPSVRSKTELKLERSVSFEKKTPKNVLSPEQEAVKSFLQKRKISNMNRSLTGRKSRSPGKMSPKRYPCSHNQSGSRSRSSSPLQRTNQSSLYNSPPIASSTFQEENYDYHDLDQAEMSPISCTFRHDPGDNSQNSFAKIEENSKLEDARYNGEKNTSSASNLSYTFRNDSQMIQTNAEEDLPGYTRNFPGNRRQYANEMIDETSSDDNNPQATEMKVEADVERNVPRNQVTFAKRENMSTPLTSTTSTDDGLSLTNVTTFTGDLANSFAETNESSNRSRWMNKDVYMFERDHRGNPIKSQYTQSHEKIDATGDWRKPPIPSKRFSSTSEIDFLKEAEKRLQFYRTRKSENEITAGVCLEKLPRSSPSYALETDSENDVREHIIKARSYELSAEQLKANPAYASPKHKSPVRGRQPGSKSRSPSPKRNANQNQSPIMLSKNTSFQQRSPNRSPSPRRSPSPKRGTSPRSPSPKRRSPVMNRSLSPQRKNKSPLASRSSPKEKNLYSQSNSNNHLRRTDINQNHSSPQQHLRVNSTTEFVDFERQLQEESLRHHRRSKSLSNLQRYQFPMSNELPLRETSVSCTNSIDGETRSIINESARYHFLHDKGMIKISSPSLKLMNGSPANRRKYEPENNNIDEESSDMVVSGSESALSGVYVDNNFHLQGKTSSEMDSKQTVSEITCTETLSESSSKSGILKRQQKDERELFEQCLKTCDEDQEVWDNVLDWMNQECDDNENEELQHELDMLMQEEDGEDHDQDGATKPKSVSPMDDSVYYSFQGQSEELRGVIAPMRNQVQTMSSIDQDNDMPGLMYVICNGTLQDIANYLNSNKTISEGEIKEALSLAIEEQNYDVTLLLLEDVCKIIHGAEGELCVDVFPAYLEQSRWQPVFVILTKQNVRGEWDSFMGFPVYRRRYDYVSSEATLVVNSDYVRSHPLTLDNFKCIRKALSSVNLQKHHSKITVVNACPCRSKKGGKVLEKGLCIVVHCLIKGFIPFNESPFPKEIDGLPVDVREGYFKLGVATPVGVSDLHQQLWDLGVDNRTTSRSQTSASSQASECESGSGSSSDVNSNNCISGSSSKASSEKGVNRIKRSAKAVAEKFDPPNLNEESKECDSSENNITRDNLIDQAESIKHSSTKQDLHMGASVCLKSGTEAGTLGGFVMLPDGDIGFITCAHNFTDANIGDDVYQHCNLAQNRSACGKVYEKFYNPGSTESVGYDVAVVKVTCQGPVDGELVNVTQEQLKLAGIYWQNSFNFANGKVQELSNLSQDDLVGKVFKFGAATGLTCGQLYKDGVYVKDFDCSYGDSRIELYNQFEVLSTPEVNTKFFDCGDSGALVFLCREGEDIVCLGMAVGCTSYGSCLVTPIEAAFKAFKFSAHFINFTKSQTSF